MRIIYTLILFFIINNLTGQIFPPNYAELNYTQVMFNYPEIKGASYYLVQIASRQEVTVFDKNIVVQQYDSTTATLIKGLEFGKLYQWRYLAFDKDKEIIYTSDIHIFDIKKCNLVNKNYYHTKINNKNVVDDGLIFLDGSRVAINRAGDPVWFMPNNVIDAWDIKMTKSGTITFLSKSGEEYFSGVEISINGEILWETPKSGRISGDSIEYFHHDFKKMSNGNYMVLGNKLVTPKININADRIWFGTVIEYNPQKKVVWSWDSQQYFPDREIYDYSKMDETKFKNIFNRQTYDPAHLNSFYLDEKNDIIYLSFKYISRIIKLKRSTGKVLASYGESIQSEGTANGFFQYMHTPILLPDSNIALFSNNNFSEMSNSFKPASVVVFSQPNKYSNVSKKIWEFSCDFDKLYPSYSIRAGNIIFMDNSDFLVNMGDPVSRIFEVNHNKKIVWDCYTEKFSEDSNKWGPSCNYRVSFTKSLYPIYFTLNNSYNLDTIYHAKNFHIEFKINNEGSNQDLYIVKYKLSNSLYNTIQTDIVLPGNTTSIDINFKDEKIKNQNINISVSSIAKPEFKRELNFYIN